VAHSFLIEPGRWTLQGTWQERNSLPISVKGMTLIAWNRDNWFTMATKLIFPKSEHRNSADILCDGLHPTRGDGPDRPLGGSLSEHRPAIALQYKGRLERGEHQYTFLLQHNHLGQIEGEGWIGPETIVQRYWGLSDDRQRHSGFETLHRMSDNIYYLTSGILVGHFLTSTMEASLERQLI
jgi:hypothetical protein